MRNAQNPYAFDGERLDWFQRFSLTPTPPGEINEALADGAALETMDIPSYLGPPAQTDCDTGVALYRLVQLWGTPNAPGMTAGAVQLERDRTTWQYLFDVEYERRASDDDEVPGSFRLSVYDYETDVSAGLWGFSPTDDGNGTVREPAESTVPAVSPPPDDFLEGVVSLTLNMVDEAVPATYKELWV
ncbi:MAG: hypothetical protein ABEH59_04425 [Halobacteriales archaeon]